MPTNFPTAADVLTDTFTDTTQEFGVHAPHHNNLADAVMAVEKFLITPAYRLIPVATTSYTVVATDYCIEVNPPTNGNTDIYMPAATGSFREILIISSPVVGVVGQTHVHANGTDLLQGTPDITISRGMGSLRLRDIRAGVWHLPGQRDGNMTGVIGIAAGAQAGGTPPGPSLSANVTDRALTGSFGTGTAPAAGEMFVVTYAAPYYANPAVVVSANNAAAGALGLYVSRNWQRLVAISCTTAPAASQGNGVYAFSILSAEVY